MTDSANRARGGNLKNIKDFSEYLLDEGFNVRINTRGHSMFPVVLTEDRVVVSRQKNPAIGNIIVFKKNDEIVCHRLVRIFEEDGIRYFQTRGDASLCTDEPITADRIVGSVIRIDRRKVSSLRRGLLLMQPLLRLGRLNAFVTSALVRVKKAVCSHKSHS